MQDDGLDLHEGTTRVSLSASVVRFGCKPSCD